MNADGRQAACPANVDDARAVLRKTCTSKSVAVEDVIENLKIVREDFERSQVLMKGWTALYSTAQQELDDPEIGSMHSRR